MASGSIRLAAKPEDLYTIEVNDNGDCISFDLRDETLLRRWFDLENAVTEAEKKYIEGFEDLTDGKEKYEYYCKYLDELCVQFEKVLGEGAIDKMFGEVRYATMFDDIAEALEPHFEIIGQKINERLDEKIKAKYGDEQSGEADGLM